MAFMVPMSISSAVAVKVGNAFGRQSKDEIKSFIKSSFIMIAVFVVCSTSIFFISPEYLMQLMSADLQVISIGISLLLIVGLFQIGDSTQIVTTGILRGMKRTKESSILVFCGYWVIGIPIGVIMAFKFGHNTQGLWTGLAISLTIVAISLYTYLITKFNRIIKF